MIEHKNRNVSLLLGLEAIRLLAQTAEACSAFVLDRGYDEAMVKLSLHCSDRSEHIAQYLSEAPDESWPLKSVIDDLTWLDNFRAITERLRTDSGRHVPSVEETEKLRSKIMTFLSLRNEQPTGVF